MSEAAMVPAGPGLNAERIKALVLNAITSPHSKRAYEKALNEFFAWWERTRPAEFNRAAVQQYRVWLEAQKLSPSTINVRLSAIRKLALEAGDNGLLAVDLATGIARVKGVKQAGVRLGNWLTREQAETLLSTPDMRTLLGKRDRALLAVLVGAGLRRSEAAELKFDHLQLREGRWVLADLVGKGNRRRSVPISTWVKALLDDWIKSAGLTLCRGDEHVFRPVNKGDRLAGRRLTSQAVFLAVKRNADVVGLPVAPHDLRRTFAKLAHRGKAALEQIQLSLGHASIQTTERYLGVQQDLHDAPCDHLGISPRSYAG